MSRFEYRELSTLFFFQMMGSAMWLVPLSRILMARGYAGLLAYAYATTALAAFISPLVFGAMADRHASPVKVLRGLAAGCATTMALASYGIDRGWSNPVILGLIQLYSFASVPTNSIASTIIFSRLQDSQRQFGPIRALGTLGWMCGCWLISGFGVDASPAAGYMGALVWLALSGFTFFLPASPPAAAAAMGWRARMGWDALALLKHHDHRVVFLTAALFCMPLAAFYPFTPPQLQHLGFEHTSAWMSLGQITEMIAMFLLAGLITRWRLKWIFAAGLAFCLVRYVFCAVDRPAWLLAGVTLHGVSFTMFFITGQIYLNERVEPAWRARGQALMSLMTGGVGNLIGYLGTGFWFQICARPGTMRWSLFWGGLASAVAAVLAFFLFAYHGQGSGFRKGHDKSTA